MVLSVVSIVVALSINFWALGRTFITSDEGWYMYLFASKEIHSASHAHLLFSWISGLDQLYANRVVSFLLKELSIVFFCFGFHRWLRKVVGVQAPMLLVFGVAALTQLYIESCPSLNYTILTQVFMLSGLGALFYAMSTGCAWLYALCGFLLSMLFPVQATCVLIVVFVMAAIWIVTGFRNTVIFALGGLAGLAFLMFVIETPEEVYTWIYGAVTERSRAENYQYSDSNLLLWLVNGSKHYFKWAFIAWVIIMLHHSVFSVIKQGKQLGLKRNIAFGLIATVMTVYLWLFLYPYAWDMEVRSFVRCLLWVGVMLSTFLSWRRYKSKPLVVVSMLLMVTPLMMCFGSNVSFIARHFTVYISLIMVTGIILGSDIGRWMRSLTIILMLMMLGRCAIMPFVNWQDTRYADQDIELKDAGYGQSVKVDRQYIDNLDFISANVPEGADVISSVDSWSTIYLLKYHALHHDYRMYSIPLISKSISDVITPERPVYIIFTMDEYLGNERRGMSLDSKGVWPNVIEELRKSYNVDVEFSTGMGYAKVSK